MRILFIVPYTPNRIYVRPYNLIRSLAARGNEITVLTLYGDESERADLAALSQICHEVIALPLPQWRSLWNVLTVLPSRTPLQAAYCWSPGLAARLDGLLNQGRSNGRPPFDAIHVEHLRGARYGLYARRRLAPNTDIPIIWDSVDCISLLFRRAMANSKSLFGRWVTRFDVGRTERHEPWLAGQFDHVLMTSPDDREALARLMPPGATTPISVLPNGVDLDHFKPDPSVTRDSASVVISGKMSYHANVTMALFLAEEIMPTVWASRPDVQLLIVGKDPGRAVRGLDEHPAITVTGTVPDLSRYLQRATVTVSPIRYGVGIQNKVLEAMACGAPVVATSQAVTAIAAVPGRDLLTADTPAGFASAILTFLDNPQQRRAIGDAGRAYVESHHNWATIAAELERIYRRARP